MFAELELDVNMHERENPKPKLCLTVIEASLRKIVINEMQLSEDTHRKEGGMRNAAKRE